MGVLCSRGKNTEIDDTSISMALMSFAISDNKKIKIDRVVLPVMLGSSLQNPHHGFEKGTTPIINIGNVISQNTGGFRFTRSHINP